MSEIIIGIDLGTTNSEVAVVVDNKIVIIEENGQAMVPSVVGIDDNNELIVGVKASNQYVLHPERTIKSIKRKMGTDEAVMLGEKSFSPQEISAMILRELKRRAETCLKRPVSKAVITVPAFFSDAQRKATRDAGAIAGLEVVRIINEPTAACMAFETKEDSKQKTVMAFDLGGGTFDVSIVKMEGDLVEVVGSHGDTLLGGDDFDKLLQSELYNQLHAQHNDTSFDLPMVSSNRLNRAAQLAKTRISESDYTNVIEDNLLCGDGQKLHFETEIKREAFETLIQPLLRKTLNSVHKAMAEAGVSISKIDEILLVGGSTRIPAVSKMLEAEFGKTPRIDIHPDLAVAYGAGVMAARLMGSDDHRVLVDITPYTFGTSALGILDGLEVPFLFCPIIKAGTPLPTSRSNTFFTAMPGQEKINVTVFEGEDKDSRKNILLGDFQISNLDSNAPRGSEIVIRMNLDLDGILHVQATEKATGLSKDIKIEKTLGKLSGDALQEAKKRVAEMFAATGEEPLVEDISPRDDYEAINDLIQKVERTEIQMDDVDREDANSAVEQLERGMEKQLSLEELQPFVTELEDLLFYMDSSK